MKHKQDRNFTRIAHSCYLECFRVHNHHGKLWIPELRLQVRVSSRNGNYQTAVNKTFAAPSWVFWLQLHSLLALSSCTRIKERMSYHFQILDSAKTLFRLKRNSKNPRVDSITTINDEEKLVAGKHDEGGLFGVRAIEAGYFGGVAQSRPSSPTPSTPTYVLSPSSNVVSWGVSWDGTTSIRTINAPVATYANRLSNLSAVRTTRNRPSPLQLNTFDARQNETSSLSPAKAMGVESSLLLPSPKSNQSAPLTRSVQEKGWISPLDVHFSRPITPQPQPQSSHRPYSYLPRLPFPNSAIEKTILVPPTPFNPVDKIDSDSASIVSYDAPQPPPKSFQPRIVTPTTFNFFPQQPPSRAARSSQRTIFPTCDEREERKTLRRSPQGHSISMHRNTLSLNSNNLPQSNVLANSNSNLPLNRPFSHNEYSPDVEMIPESHALNVADTSFRSTTPSAINKQRTPDGNRSRPSSTHRRSRPTSSNRHSSSSSIRSLSRTQSSYKSHSREESVEDRKSRHSLQSYYELTAFPRNCSGSAHGLAGDSDPSQESPFSNSMALSGLSPKSSESSIDSLALDSTQRTRNSDPSSLEKMELFGLTAPRPNHLSGNSAFGARAGSAMGRNASLSEASSSSIGELYDSYYQPSAQVQRDSQLQNQEEEDTGQIVDSGRKPTPLKLGFGSKFAGEIIKEAPSPGVGPHTLWQD